MIVSKYFIDSSVWLGYFIGDMPKAKTIIESDNLLITSVVSLHEIYKKFITLGEDSEKIIKFIEDMSIIVGIDKKIAIESAKNCVKYSLHTVGSLIYTSSVENSDVFVTADNDFRKTPNTIVIPAR